MFSTFVANFSMLTEISNEAIALAGGEPINITANLYFGIASTILVAGVVTSDGEAPTGADRRKDVPAGALIGLPVPAGTVEGRAHRAPPRKVTGVVGISTSPALGRAAHNSSSPAA